MPQYLIISASSGLVSGAPDVSGNFNLTLSVSNSIGTKQQAIAVSIEDNTDNTPPTAPVILSDVNHSVNQNNPSLRDFDLNITPSQLGGSEVYEYDVWLGNVFQTAITNSPVLGGWFPETLVVKSIATGTYIVKVQSKDLLGNYSPFSNEVEVVLI